MGLITGKKEFFPRSLKNLIPKRIEDPSSLFLLIYGRWRSRRRRASKFTDLQARIYTAPVCVCGVSTCTEAMKHSIYRTRGTLRVAATTEIPCEQSRVQGIGPLTRGPSIGSSQSASQRGLKFPGGSPRGTASSNVDVLGAHFYSIALLGATSQPWFSSFFHRYPREPRVPWERKTVASCLSAKTHVNSVKPPRLPSMTLQNCFDRQLLHVSAS